MLGFDSLVRTGTSLLVKPSTEHIQSRNLLKEQSVQVLGPGIDPPQTDSRS